jgi:hypothetical protein
MNSIEKITEESLLKKVADGVSRKSVWTKPMLLLTKDGDDYLYISDTLNEIYPKSKCINVDPSYYRFDVVDGEQVLVLLTGDEEVIIDGHSPEVEFYKNLGGPLGYDEEHHRYCVGLCKYESKPVISFICISDKLCSIDSIPEWMYNEFDIVMLDLKY